MGRAQKLKQQRKEEEARRKEEERRERRHKVMIIIVCILAVAVTVFLIIMVNYLKKEKVTVQEMVLETTRGEIVIELSGEKAPLTVDHIISLVEQGFYDNLCWYRIEDFVVQTGSHVQTLLAQDEGSEPDQALFEEAMTKDREAGSVLDEIAESNLRGAVGMAKPSDPETQEPLPNSATVEFYILKQDATFLDSHFTVFGNVVQGMEVVDSLEDSDLIVKATVREFERRVD